MSNQLNKMNKYLNTQERTDWKPVIKFLAAVIYATGLIYAGSHVYSYISTIMTSDFTKAMAYIGGTGIILNGAALPFAIHSWALEKTHRLFAIGFYVLDLLLIAGFVWANTNIAQGNHIALVDQYMTWISPLTFMNTILTWGVLFILDPEARLQYEIDRLDQQAQIIDAKTDMMIKISQAEKQSDQKLLSAGVDLDQNNIFSGTPRTTRKPEKPSDQWASQVEKYNFTQAPEKRYTPPFSNEVPENIDYLSGFTVQVDEPDENEINMFSGNHSGTAPKG